MRNQNIAFSPGDRPGEPLERIALSLADRADALAFSHVLPRVPRPLSNAIASRL